jgi:predicted O-methyltransferase YrrM
LTYFGFECPINYIKFISHLKRRRKKMTCQEWTRERLFDLSIAHRSFCAFHAGLQLRIFTIIGDENLTAHEIALKCEASSRGITMLLDALAAMKILKKHPDKTYANSQAAASFLIEGTQDYIGYMSIFFNSLLTAWTELPKAVRTGSPVMTNAPFGDEIMREHFLMGMFSMSMSSAPQIARQINLSQRKHLLDLGGGPGTHAIHFCRQNPALRATIFDLKTTRPIAERVLDQFEMRHRIEFLGGNYLDDPFGGPYDVVWISKVLPNEGRQKCQHVINKAVSAMESGGIILIHDYMVNPLGDGPLSPALFALEMLVQSDEGRVYSEKDYTEMLYNAGVKDVKRLPYRGPGDTGILSGIL